MVPRLFAPFNKKGVFLLNIKDIRQKMFDTRLSVAMLGVKERSNINHPLYQEFKKLKELYTKALFEEKEKEEQENEKHKSR